MVHGTRGVAAEAEQPQKESLCRGLVLRAQDTHLQLPPRKFHEHFHEVCVESVPWVPPTRQSYVTIATEVAWHQEVNSAGQWQAGSQHQHFQAQLEASTMAGSSHCYQASSAHVLGRRGSQLQGLGSSGWQRRGGR